MAQLFCSINSKLTVYMKVINDLKVKLKLKRARQVLIAVVVIALLVVLFGGKSADEAVTSNSKPQVSLTTPLEYSGGQSLSLIGTVRAFSEAEITSEKSGRVVGVNVSLGQWVSAGQVIGSLENAAERASVLQAEGVYDAAVAAAAQSGVGVDEAKNGLVSAQNNAVATFQSSYNTTNGIVRNNIDTFFSDPDARVPGLRIDGKGMTTSLNAERVAYQTLLPEWQAKSNTISITANLEAELAYAKTQVQRTTAFVDSFLTLFANQDNGSRYSDAELQGFVTSFTALRANLIGVESNINAALTSLQSAKDGVRRAELAAQGGTTSAADAQVKQALGALRAAQANLSKTIFRTPISGTVNSLSIRQGDFINSFVPVAIVANNNALEIVTYVSDSERSLIAEGDEVLVEGAYTGVVTHISPAVNANTGKTEVRIATENTDIVNGDTVRVTKQASKAQAATKTIIVPLSAVKFDIADGFVFVVEDGRLVERPVMLGIVRGGSVEITNGLAATDAFVKDARGLKADIEVEITN